MNPNDLLTLLDLKGTTAMVAPCGLTDTGSELAPPTEASPTVFEVDEWSLRRGRDLVDESERLRGAGTDEFAAADFFTASFDPDPRLRDTCVDPLRREFLAQLLETPSYHELHATTRLDDTASAIAATYFAEEFARLKDESGARAADAVGREMDVLRAAERAVATAEADVGELQEAASALGLGPGGPGHNDPRRIAELFRRVRSDGVLRRICDLAGRYRRVAQSRQRRKTEHGLDDVVGVAMGGDLGRLLPMELARLSDPEFELDALCRFVERQSLCREHHAVEPGGMGPIVCVVDESGSMENEKCHSAKALALALAWIARRQRRWCGLIAYSGDSGERLLALPPGQWDELALCDWLAAFLGDGSTLDVPVREMPEFYRRIGAPNGITDVIFLTDAQCRIPQADRDPFLHRKKEVQARRDLAAISDEVHLLETLTPDSEGVGRVLSL